MNKVPNTFYTILAMVAIAGLVLYPAFVITADHTPAQFEDASENITTPYENTPWYMIGAAPVFLISGTVAIVGGPIIALWHHGPKRFD